MQKDIKDLKINMHMKNKGKTKAQTKEKSYHHKKEKETIMKIKPENNKIQPTKDV